MRDPFLTDLK